MKKHNYALQNADKRPRLQSTSWRNTYMFCYLDFCCYVEANGRNYIHFLISFPWNFRRQDDRAALTELSTVEKKCKRICHGNEWMKKHIIMLYKTPTLCGAVVLKVMDQKTLVKRRGGYNVLLTVYTLGAFTRHELIYIGNLARHSFSLFDWNKTQPQTSKTSEQRLAYH